jgi:hypothetical protein
MLAGLAAAGPFLPIDLPPISLRLIVKSGIVAWLDAACWVRIRD